MLAADLIWGDQRVGGLLNAVVKEAVHVPLADHEAFLDGSQQVAIAFRLRLP
ncbi:hypothetical protein D3C86_1867970 [compost metagenome]